MRFTRLYKIGWFYNCLVMSLMFTMNGFLFWTSNIGEIRYIQIDSKIWGIKKHRNPTDGTSRTFFVRHKKSYKYGIYNYCTMLNTNLIYNTRSLRWFIFCVYRTNTQFWRVGPAWLFNSCRSKHPTWAKKTYLYMLKF